MCQFCNANPTKLCIECGQNVCVEKRQVCVDCGGWICPICMALIYGPSCNSCLKLRDGEYSVSLGRKFACQTKS